MEGGPKRVTNTRALQAAKCANGPANAVVFTSGLTTRARGTHARSDPCIHSHSFCHSVTAQTERYCDINTQEGKRVKGRHAGHVRAAILSVRRTNIHAGVKKEGRVNPLCQKVIQFHLIFPSENVSMKQ